MDEMHSQDFTVLNRTKTLFGISYRLLSCLYFQVWTAAPFAAAFHLSSACDLTCLAVSDFPDTQVLPKYFSPFCFYKIDYFSGTLLNVFYFTNDN